MASVFSNTVCTLGEGPLWHPKEKALYWFDILAKRLYRRVGDSERFWQFDEHVSAAGWIDVGVLLIASETSLFRFDTQDSSTTVLCDLEGVNDVTRSNDGRADPWGGFWIGTMGKSAEPNAGAIYRFWGGELHKLFGEITISNAICFAPDKTHAFFADTHTQRIMQVALDAEGFPADAPRVFVDLTEEDLNPDGAVVDARGNLWVAQWGAGRVACYSPDGSFERAIAVPGLQTTCPAFGGENMDTLYVTSAADGLYKPSASDGKTFAVQAGTIGQEEHQVKL